MMLKIVHLCFTERSKTPFFKKGYKYDCEKSHDITVKFRIPERLIDALNRGEDMYPDHEIINQAVYDYNMNMFQHKINRWLRREGYKKITKKKATLACKYIDFANHKILNLDPNWIPEHYEGI